LAFVVLIELLGFLPGDTLVLRTWTFTLAAALTLAPLLHDLLRVLPRNYRAPWSMVAMTALPVAMAILAFVARATAITYSEVTGVVALDVGSTFDIVVALGFLVILGMFNFSFINLVLGSLIRRLEDLAATDQLTGLNNRRVAMQRLDEEHARFLRSGQRYALIMMDLDHFKSINDQFGHDVGDEVLKSLAETLKLALPPGHDVGRWGGEEFVVITPPGATHLPLHDLAERLRAAAAFWPGRTVVLVEESTLGPALVAELVAAGLEVESAPASGSKSARLLRCSAIPFGSIHRVPSSHGWTFLDAVLALPRSEAVRQHSHVLDALSQLLAWVFGLQATEPRRVHTDEFFQVFREDTGSSIGFVWRAGGSRWRYAVGMKRAPRFEPSRDSAIAALEGEARRAGVSP